MQLATKRLLLFRGGNPLTHWLAIEPANLLAFFPLNEGSGSVIRNAAPSGSSYNGAYTGVTWDGTLSPIGEPVPFWDGANDCGNIYSAALAAAFSGAEGTIALWVKVSAAGVWTDGANRNLATLRANGANSQIRIIKTSTANRLSYIYDNGTATQQINRDATSDTGWIHLALTYSKTANAVKAFFNGNQTGTTQTGLDAFTGTLLGTNTCLGAFSTVPTAVFSGYLSNAGIWSVALTAAQIASLATP